MTQTSRELDSDRRAKTLLGGLRQTPMRRGGRISEEKGVLQNTIAGAIESQGVLRRLAKRTALQLILKFEVIELGDRAAWRAVGQRLRQETHRLRTNVGLVDRQIVIALPKLSAEQIERLLADLRAVDPKIARTILNAALDAAEPLSAGRRYLAEYHRVAEQLKNIDVTLARTLANATFMARVPRKKAIDHVKHFADLVAQFQDDVDFVRTVARAACRAPDPIKAARGFIADYQAVATTLMSTGVESRIARTLAGIASVGLDPIPTAYRLLENFEAIVRYAKKTHPWVARTIALSACRAADPLGTARVYVNNYDTIVRVISRTDPRRARAVAAQTFRSDNPLRWANRYLAKLRGTRSSETSAVP